MKTCVTKDDAPEKFVAKIQYDHRICKVKKISLPIGNRPATVSNNFDEAKTTSKARKRKERQESVSSLYQDTKVIRSNSEERPVAIKGTEEKNSGIRRVSSSGDFPKSTSDEKIKLPVQENDQSEIIFSYDDYEHDKKRSHERFARPHTFRSRKYPNKRFKVRSQSKIKQKNELQECSKKNMSTTTTVTERQPHNLEQDVACSTRFLDIHQPEIERSPSPVHTQVSPVVDFATLHEQVDCSEPLLSQPNRQVNENIETMPSQFIASNKLLSSPRNSYIATQRIYLDPDVPQTNMPLKMLMQNPVDERIQKLNKQINSCKKKIMVCEADFEAKTGVKPSQFDKLNDDAMRKLYVELSKLKKEKKQLSEISVGCSRLNLSNTGGLGEKLFSLKETVEEMKQKLSTERDNANRHFNLETMTAEQLIEEKIATQKALLFLESVHGRPQSKEDRDIVRPFYDRYRILKRMIAKISSNVGPTGELATILENEAMHFVTPTSSSNDTESEKTEQLNVYFADDNDKTLSVDENLHSLTKPDLIKQVKIVTEDKKELRQKIKEFETSTQAKLCRMLTKEDKKPMEELYIAYKKIKGRLRLLEALVAKN